MSFHDPHESSQLSHAHPQGPHLCLQSIMAANQEDMVFTQTERAAALCFIDDKAEWVGEQLETVTKGYMKITRSCIEGVKFLDTAKDAKDLKEIIRYNLQNQASQSRAAWSATNRLDGVINRVELLKSRLEDMDRSVNKLQGGQNTLNTKVYEMDTNINKVQSDINNLQSGQNALNTKVGNLNTKVGEIDTNMT